MLSGFLVESSVLSGFSSYYAFLSPMVLFRTETVLVSLFPFLSTFNLANNKPTTSVFLTEHPWCLNIYTMRNIFWTRFDPKVGAINLLSGSLPSGCPWGNSFLQVCANMSSHCGFPGHPKENDNLPTTSLIPLDFLNALQHCIITSLVFCLVC